MRKCICVTYHLAVSSEWVRGGEVVEAVNDVRLQVHHAAEVCDARLQLLDTHVYGGQREGAPGAAAPPTPLIPVPPHSTRQQLHVSNRVSISPTNHEIYM